MAVGAVGATGSGILVGEFTIVPRSRPGAGEYGYVSTPAVKMPEGRGDVYYYGVKIKGDHTIPGVRPVGPPTPNYTAPPEQVDPTSPEQRAKGGANQTPSTESTGARLSGDTLSALNFATRDIGGTRDEAEDPTRPEESDAAAASVSGAKDDSKKTPLEQLKADEEEKSGPGGVKDESKMTPLEKLKEDARLSATGKKDDSQQSSARTPFGAPRRGGQVNFAV